MVFINADIQEVGLKSAKKSEGPNKAISKQKPNHDSKRRKQAQRAGSNKRTKQSLVKKTSELKKTKNHNAQKSPANSTTEKAKFEFDSLNGIIAINSIESKAAEGTQKSFGHGLRNAEPLVFEEIIRACFNNPDRKNYPDFIWEGQRGTLHEQNESPDF